ncbi:FAD-dependent oxidoreductase [Sinanaerobacter sp. ZZT-01]|uniref:FAD-dependent oxidoreductase n=1 Tax=Sinanaerobacter sp. ZZT-01 TaxID=3111540 RepID=UPI002D77D5D9|nr:FAD-dependent oxidoreductase [Sinanaerobacter sp. ZZT-01]WRR94313.1 FAD-dependent oxidoreductase [Sinanaerobacter sp. ZZT-01]
MKTVELTKDLHWIGTLDPDLKVFDIIMYTEFGTSYNSYLIRGSEKIAIFETAKEKFFDEYLERLKTLVSIEDISYIVVNHTEPDHSGSIAKLLELNPKIKIVGSAAAINFVKEICNRDLHSVVVKDGDTLSLGDKTLRFINAPNLHWPDSIYTYIEEEKTLVTCDSFGAHYSLEKVTNDKIENKEDYMKALRYYFDNIMGPFKQDVLKAIAKIDELDYVRICPGHGPVLVENPKEVVEYYREWATEINPNKKKTVVIPYVSAYGYTESMAEEIKKGIQAAGDMEVRLYDLVTTDHKTVLDDMYWADGLLFGTPTIVGDALKPIWDLLTSIFAKTHGKKLASAFGSYGWSGEAVPNVLERLKQLNMKVYGEGLRIRFKPSLAQFQECFEFGFGFGASVLAGKIVDAKPVKGATRKWKCLICGEIVEGDEPPQACPVCGVGPEQFVEVQQDLVTFQSSKDEKFIVIGNGAAGMSACEEIRKRNNVCSIEMISSEKVNTYNRPMLTKGILTEIDDLNFFVKEAEWYQANNIKVTLGATVKELHTNEKTVALDNGETRSYDKLILATGAECFVPPIKGVEKKGVFTIRNIADVHQIQAYKENTESAIVIGGGVLGLETAWELQQAGMKVAVIELSTGLMSRQLDERGSELLQDEVERVGISVFTNVGIAEIIGEEYTEGIRLTDGIEIKGGLVILSTGIKPNVELAKNAGLESGRSIIVNEKMQTSSPDIYACGDCAEFKGINYAIWNQSLEMGKTAGTNAAGDEAVYETVIPSNAFNGMNTSLFAIGDNGKDPEKRYKSVELLDDGKGVYEKLYFWNDRFCGGILIGDVGRSARLLTAFQDQESMKSMLSLF